MSDLRKAAEMALEVFGGSDWNEEAVDSSWADKANAAVKALRQALAQPSDSVEQEPVAWVAPDGSIRKDCSAKRFNEWAWSENEFKPLYAAPVDTVNISQERVDETAKRGHKAVGLSDRDRLEAIISVVCRYLPPDGIDIKTAMSKIIELVDPLPPKREWVGLTDEDKQELDEKHGDDVLAHLDAIEAKLKEKNSVL